jgi:hypothetical protein
MRKAGGHCPENIRVKNGFPQQIDDLKEMDSKHINPHFYDAIDITLT